MEASSRVQLDLDEDVQLMLAFRAGDVSAFDALFSRWAAPLLRFVQRMVGDAGLAEELVQEVFLRVHRSRERYSPDAKFSTWLYRIATNTALNEIRRPRNKSVHESSDAEGAASLWDPSAPVDDLVHSRALAAQVEREMGLLAENQRAALWLAVVEGHSYAEVAVMLDVTEKAVKALVHRARTALAAKLPATEY